MGPCICGKRNNLLRVASDSQERAGIRSIPPGCSLGDRVCTAAPATPEPGTSGRAPAEKQNSVNAAPPPRTQLGVAFNSRSPRVAARGAHAIPKARNQSVVRARSAYIGGAERRVALLASSSLTAIVDVLKQDGPHRSGCAPPRPADASGDGSERRCTLLAEQLARDRHRRAEALQSQRRLLRAVL